MAKPAFGTYCNILEKLYMNKRMLNRGKKYKIVVFRVNLGPLNSHTIGGNRGPALQ